MRMPVADSTGSGTRIDKEGVEHPLDPHSWVETDLQDRIVASGGSAWVRYRETGEQVEVVDGQTYELVAPPNPDVIDVRSATPAAEAIAAAIQGIGTDEDAIYRALEMAPHDHSRGPWFEQLRFYFHHITGRELDEALRDELSSHELERALALLQ